MPVFAGCKPRPHRLPGLIFGGLLLLSMLACSSFGFVDSDSSNVELENTVAAMRATLEALNTQPTQTAIPPAPQIVVITATPTNTPMPTLAPEVTSTPAPIPTATATEIPPAAPQGRTIVIVVTPTSPATATPYPYAPINTGPRNDTAVGQEQEILLHWSWNGLLEPGEFYEVKLRPEAQPRSAYIAQELGLAHDFKATVGPGRYEWTVQIVKGYFINNSGHPDDWVFEAFRSPESAPRIIIVVDDGHGNNDDNDDDDDDDRNNPPSFSQADPPEPRIPYGLAVGGIAFVAFATITRYTTHKNETVIRR